MASQAVIDSLGAMCAEGMRARVRALQAKACVCALSSRVDCTVMPCVQSADPGPERCRFQSAACLLPRPCKLPAASEETGARRPGGKSDS